MSIGRHRRFAFEASSYKHFLSVFVIVAYVFITSGPALQGALFNPDVLRLIDHARSHGPFAGFFGDPGGWAYLYRPLFVLQAWISYSLFGLNYAGYQVLGTLQCVLATVIIYFAVFLLIRDNLVALLLSLLYTPHPYTSIVTTWVIDSAPICTMTVAGVLILLAKRRQSLRWYGAFVALLTLAPLAREDGLIVFPAVAAYLLVGLLMRYITRREALSLFLGSALSALIYMGMRAQAIGLLPQQKGGYTITGFFWVNLTPDQIAAFGALPRLGYYLYTGLAHIAANFIPVFGRTGVLSSDQAGELIASALLTAVLIFIIWLAQPWRPPRLPRTLAVVVMTTAVPASVVLLTPASTASLVNSIFASLAMHGVLSLFIWYGAFHRSHWTEGQKAAAAFALALILASGLVHFLFFEYRLFFLGLLGWIILLAVCIHHRPAGRWNTSLRAAALILVMIMVIISGVRLYKSLPTFRPGQFHQALCAPWAPDALVLQAAERYQVDVNAVLACRPEASR